jgi:hypothetical protein
MQIADVRMGLADHFAISAHQDTQYAVRTRVLRPHVQQDLVRFQQLIFAKFRH